MSSHRYHTLGLSLLSLAALALPMAFGTGCVSQGEYDRLKYAQRNAEADRDRLRDELNNERAKTLELQTRLAELSKQLKSRDDLIANLQGENNRMQEQLKKLQDLADKLAASGGPTEPVIITRSLLPAPLDQRLKELAAKYPGVIEYLPEQGVVRFKSDMTFALGSYIVREDVKPILREFAEICASADAAPFDVLVVGNTDTVPIVKIKNVCPTNWHLSSYRAISVLEQMLAARVDPSRCGALGYGEFRPIVPNQPGPAGTEKNRRVEIYLVPKGHKGPQALAPAGEVKTTIERGGAEGPAAPTDNTAPATP